MSDWLKFSRHHHWEAMRLCILFLKLFCCKINPDCIHLSQSIEFCQQEKIEVCFVWQLQTQSLYWRTLTDLIPLPFHSIISWWASKITEKQIEVPQFTSYHLVFWWYMYIKRIHAIYNDTLVTDDERCGGMLTGFLTVTVRIWSWHW